MSMAAFLISDKIDFKSKTIRTNKEGDYVVIKGSIHQEQKTVVNICHPTSEHLKIASINRTEGRNRQQYKNIGCLQYPTFNIKFYCIAVYLTFKEIIPVLLKLFQKS